MNEELAQALGINTRLVRFVTFGLGAGLAALAGALLTPLISVHPNLGVPWLINAFMLVLVAGVSLLNLALAALVLGGAQRSEERRVGKSVDLGGRRIIKKKKKKTTEGACVVCL